MISGHPFEEPFLTYHVQRAKAGDYNSARWLRYNARKAQTAGIPVDPYVNLLIVLMRSGGGPRAWARKQRPKRKGQRGAGLGDHNQLLFAREVWKRIHLSGLTVENAVDKVRKCFDLESPYGVRNAYYRFARASNAPDRRVFLVELKRNFLDQHNQLRRLAQRLNSILNKLSSF